MKTPLRINLTCDMSLYVNNVTMRHSKIAARQYATVEAAETVWTDHRKTLARESHSHTNSATGPRMDTCCSPCERNSIVEVTDKHETMVANNSTAEANY